MDKLETKTKKIIGHTASFLIGTAVVGVAVGAAVGAVGAAATAAAAAGTAAAAAAGTAAAGTGTAAAGTAAEFKPLSAVKGMLAGLLVSTGFAFYDLKQNYVNVPKTPEMKKVIAHAPEDQKTEIENGMIKVAASAINDFRKSVVVDQNKTAQDLEEMCRTNPKAVELSGGNCPKLQLAQ